MKNNTRRMLAILTAMLLLIGVAAPQSAAVLAEEEIPVIEMTEELPEIGRGGTLTIPPTNPMMSQ